MEEKNKLTNLVFCDENGNRIEIFPHSEFSSVVKSPGMELYEATEQAFNITKTQYAKLLEYSKDKGDKWVKFVLFNLGDEDKLYIIFGNPKQNKHSVCFLYAILEDTRTPEYDPLREIMREILELKRQQTELTEKSEIIHYFNKMLHEVLKETTKSGCMKVILAGSGTITNGITETGEEQRGFFCNSKSGHYKPSQEIFNEQIIELLPIFLPDGLNVYVNSAPTPSQLTKVYGTTQTTYYGITDENNKFYSGTCFTPIQYVIAHTRANKKKRSESKSPEKKAMKVEVENVHNASNATQKHRRKQNKEVVKNKQASEKKQASQSQTRKTSHNSRRVSRSESRRDR